MSWNTYVEDDGIHIVPVNDSQEHYLTVECFCEPEIRTKNGVPIFVHSAYDGREIVEQAEAIIKGVGSGS